MSDELYKEINEMFKTTFLEGFHDEADSGVCGWENSGASTYAETLVARFADLQQRLAAAEGIVAKLKEKTAWYESSTRVWRDDTDMEHVWAWDGREAFALMKGIWELWPDHTPAEIIESGQRNYHGFRELSRTQLVELLKKYPLPHEAKGELDLAQHHVQCLSDVLVKAMRASGMIHANAEPSGAELVMLGEQMAEQVAVVKQLPHTADGVAVAPGMTVYFNGWEYRVPEEAWSESNSYVPVDAAYSTREASVEAARRSLKAAQAALAKQPTGETK